MHDHILRLALLWRTQSIPAGGEMLFTCVWDVFIQRKRERCFTCFCFSGSGVCSWTPALQDTLHIWTHRHNNAARQIFHSIVYIYIYAYAFIQSDLKLHSGYTFFVSMCVPWESNPQPFALLMQCSTTEPQEHNWEHNWRLLVTLYNKVHSLTWTILLQHLLILVHVDFSIY